MHGVVRGMQSGGVLKSLKCGGTTNACWYVRRGDARPARGVLRRAPRLRSCGASSRDRRSSAVASDHLIALPCGLLTLRFITVDAALHVVGDVGEIPPLTAGENAI